MYGFGSQPSRLTVKVIKGFRIQYLHQFGTAPGRVGEGCGQVGANEHIPIEVEHQCRASHQQRCVVQRVDREQHFDERTGGHHKVTGQRSHTIVLGYVAAATLDDAPPLLEISRNS